MLKTLKNAYIPRKMDVEKVVDKKRGFPQEKRGFCLSSAVHRQVMNTVEKIVEKISVSGVDV